jgi:3-oxoacyl-[acyl-carrier-protein] synthase-3
VSNHDMTQLLSARGLETSDEWIVSRSGISARHFVDDGMLSSDLGTAAARQAIDMAGLQPDDIDLIIMATSTPDFLGGFPSTACVVQRKLGITNDCAALDVQAVCSGFVYAMSVADNFIRGGMYKRVLVIGAEVFSRILDFNDRTTCVLFGDGAGAVVLSASDEPGVLATRLHADGRHADILCVPGAVQGGAIEGSAFLYMDGQAVFKLAVSVLEKVANEVLQAAGMEASQIDWLIPHQANIRIMQGTAKKLGLPMEKMVVTVDQHGNTSAASIPLALDVAVRDGRIKAGQHLLMEGVGGGFTWGAVLARF